MKRLEVGKLYSCSEYFLLLYPDKDTAAIALAITATADEAAAYWNRKLQNHKPVSYCNPLTPLLVLSVNEKYVEVLAEDKRGWIINENWLEIKEIS
jgi:hypothetical protein